MKDELISSSGDLTLSVKTLELGKIITNALEIKKYVEEKIKSYSVDDYKGDDKQAKFDKAELNNAAKKLNDERIRLEKEWLSPFLEFKEIVNETTGLLNTASAKLDLIVKEQAEKEKQEKKKQITELWEQENFSFVSLDRVFNSKWLNKTCKLSMIQEEIKNIIDTIKKDLQAIDSFTADSEVLKAFYHQTLDLQTTLNKGAELKASRLKVKEEAEKEKQNAIKENSVLKNEIENRKIKEIKSNELDKNKTSPKMPEYVFNVVGSIEQISEVMKIAELTEMDFFQSICVKGTEKKTTVFKSMLESKGLTYTKKGFLTLQLN